MTFLEKLDLQMRAGKHLCVGLDTQYDKLPDYVRSELPDALAMLEFNKGIINATQQFAGAFKLNLAFYLQRGENGLCALQNTLKYLQEYYPEVLVILDCKIGDIGNTNAAWADFAFSVLPGVDAITATGYVGLYSFAPVWQKYPDKGIFFLDLTSNPENKELQLQPMYLLVANILHSLGYDDNDPNNVQIIPPHLGITTGEFINDFCAKMNIASVASLGKGYAYLPTVWQDMIIRINALNRKNGKLICGAVFGATNIGQLQDYAKITETFTLFPGVGAQGGSVEEVVATMADKPFLINISRDIIFASKGSDYASCAGSRAEYYFDLIKKVKGE